MITTRRLYHEDPALDRFRARVCAVRPGPDGTTDITLDETAFYPTGGGQPHDRGTLGGRRVLEVLEEGEAVIHRVEGGPLDGIVEGEVDWAIRLDHRQQHTGQHILSRVLLDRIGAATVGFHLGRESCSIDLDREVEEPVLDEAEREANRIVLADVEVSARWYDSPAALPASVRKEAPVEGAIRVISIGEFDATPCCGTHCPRSGQVGPVKILKAERHRGGSRVTFLCGGRALEDHRRRHRILRDLGRVFTTEDFEVPDRVTALQEEVKAMRQRLERAETDLREQLSRTWAAEAAPDGFVRELPAERVDWLAPLGADLAARRQGPVLLFARTPPGIRFALADPGGRARELLAALTALDGVRGGGSERAGQGVGTIDGWNRVLDAWSGAVTGKDRDPS